MARLVHFEQFAQDAQKTMDFYSTVFGWSFQKYGDFPYWLAITGPDDQPGINGGITGEPLPNGQTVVNTVEVENVDEIVAQAQRAGAKIAQEKQAIPGMGWFAYLFDPAGVVVGVFETDENARATGD